MEQRNKGLSPGRARVLPGSGPVGRRSGEPRAAEPTCSKRVGFPSHGPSADPRLDPADRSRTRTTGDSATPRGQAAAVAARDRQPKRGGGAAAHQALGRRRSRVTGSLGLPEGFVEPLKYCLYSNISSRLVPSPYSSEAEHQSRKLGVVSSILTGGIRCSLYPFYRVRRRHPSFYILRSSQTGQ